MLQSKDMESPIVFKQKKEFFIIYRKEGSHDPNKNFLNYH